MIQKDNLYFSTLERFLAKKIAADKRNTTYRTGSLDAEPVAGEPDILWQSTVYIRSPKMQWKFGIIYDFSGGGSEFETRLNELERQQNGTFITLEELKSQKVGRNELVTVNRQSLIGKGNIDTTPTRMTDADVDDILNQL